MIADKGYSSRANREHLAQTWCQIDYPGEGEIRSRTRRRRGSTGGHPHPFSTQIDQRRIVVGCCFNRCKGCRGIAARYNWLVRDYLGGLKLVDLLAWLRDPSDTP
ncbi:Transposase DDE domain-containing protein [Streptoalloteichus tenebrarius]|uniref:Transposase DDE domain-containing protein n=1 Tax=Streptoalloteichus tenebrarius (strain ATCC 17920 / DSM 40477 / JCM 4838 / CBS 697.72 / NBRC 16177 / NCIMB 11028 / NRRL B-12390 / A12253. 1 / ISP 5477) TaxID=1933 RepID=A0ABT1HPX4_STRSD|nr:hypothetical protein [Streptoalloteichus tenebrarius]MCP2257569.1 Transposase DDE domain-containing protein [Streptoalloteichus tenebrarius]BFE98523.1 hypothetical protein GCM10020241_01990 [Streptoalloteichus tenebrarius]